MITGSVAMNVNLCRETNVASLIIFLLLLSVGLAGISMYYNYLYVKLKESKTSKVESYSDEN